MALEIPKRMNLVILTMLILLTLELALQLCAARSDSSTMQSSRGSQRDLLESTPDETFSGSIASHHDQTLMVELIPPNHYESPFYQQNLTRAERVAVSVKNSRARMMRMSRQLSSKTPFTSQGVFYKEEAYVMRVTIGDPPRTFSVIADTGSDLCWIQCVGCSPCLKQPDSYFDPSTSLTYYVVGCDDGPCYNVSNRGCSDFYYECLYGYVYGDRTEANGTLSQETLTLFSATGQATTFDSFYFGCGYGEAGNLSDTDGIFGLGQGSLSMVTQLGAGIDHKFSYCLVDHTVPNLKSNLLLGSEGSLPLKYTKLLISPAVKVTYYYVDLRVISVAGVSVPFPGDTFTIDYPTGTGGVILDSGTYLTYLAEGAYDPVVKQLKKLITYKIIQHGFPNPDGLPVCYDTSGATTVKFPSVSFTLGSVVLTPNPNKNIFIPIGDNDNIYCLSVISVASGKTSILGNIWQQNFQIAYDLQNQTVGFAQTNCGKK